MSVELKFKPEEFRHEFEGEVRFSDVDSFNVVHNLTYLYWLEWARTDYLFEIGLPKDDSIFSKRMPILTVNTNIDYFSALKFTDKYKVLTKVGRIGKSSLRFDSLIVSNDRIITQSSTTLVYVNAETNEAINIPDEIKELINKFEKNGS